ncbi:MAG: hypothetical protein WAQ27_04705 [Candidatus Microsaccharimonas sp.]
MMQSKIEGLVTNPVQIKLINFFKYRQKLSYPDVIFRWNDALPMLSYLFLCITLLCVARKHRLTFVQATTYDIEWNGQPL